MAQVAVDIDDNLYPFCDLARAILTEQGFEAGDKKMIAAAYAPWPEWRSPADLLGLETWLDVVAKCHDDDMILKQEPYAGSVDTLQELVDAGHELLYISNRATETRAATQGWLADNEFPEGGLVVTSKDKRSFVAYCQYLIDDRPKTLVNFAYDAQWNGAPRVAFALTKEYNRGLTDVPGIYLAPTWNGIRHYLIDQKLIESESRDKTYS